MSVVVGCLKRLWPNKSSCVNLFTQVEKNPATAGVGVFFALSVSLSAPRPMFRRGG